MISENTLLKIALACSLLGLLVLYFSSTNIDVKEYKPRILNKNVGDDIKLEGIITKIADKGDVIYIEVSQQYPTTIVLFADNNNLKLNNGDTIEIIGKVQEYKGKNEIIAQKIRVLS